MHFRRQARPPQNLSGLGDPNKIEELLLLHRKAFAKVRPAQKAQGAIASAIVLHGWSFAYSRYILDQKSSLSPNCTARMLPDPVTGFPAPTSGVAQPHPNVVVLEGSLNWPTP